MPPKAAPSSASETRTAREETTPPTPAGTYVADDDSDSESESDSRTGSLGIQELIKLDKLKYDRSNYSI